MKEFSVYEVFALLIPGAVLLCGIALMGYADQVPAMLGAMSFGVTALAVLTAFVTGIMIQAVGKIVTRVIERTLPSRRLQHFTRIITGLNADQRERLLTVFAQRFGYRGRTIDPLEDPREFNRACKEALVELRSENVAQHVERLDAYETMFRGLASAFTIIAGVAVAGAALPVVTASLLAAALLCYWRVVKSSELRYRELFLQVLVAARRAGR
jgi:hypothetical protein